MDTFDLNQTIETSLQALPFKNNKRLYEALVTMVVKLRTDRNYTARGFKDAGFTQIVKAETGMQVTIAVEPVSFFNAWASPPDLKQHHSLIAGPFDVFYRGEEGIRLLRKSKGIIKGTVDDRIGKVGGSFSDIPLKIGITFGALYGDPERARDVALEDVRKNIKQLYPEEAVMIIMHELGHLYQYFRYIVSQVTFNQVMTTANRLATEQTDRVKHVEIYKEAASVLKVDVDPDALAGRSPQEIYLVFVRADRQRMRSGDGSEIYDMVSFESLADQFAIRAGDAVYHSTALEKMSKLDNDPATRSMFAHVFIETISLIVLIGINVVVPGAIVITLMLLLLIGRPDVDTYDNAEVRIRRIKEQMIDQLRHTNEARLVEDIKAVDEALNSMSAKREFYLFLYQTLSPSGRAERTQALFQRKLEEMTHSDIVWYSRRLDNAVS